MAKAIQTQNQTRELPPCRAACPADINVQGYIALIQQGKFRESVELIRKSMPFPAICGRICFSPCQDACVRKEIDQPVQVRHLKRLAADIEREQGRTRPDQIPKSHADKVAIVGSGPAGLAAAYELAKLGYPVTVFERMPEPGGMMRYGIPDYRLRKYVVANEIAYIQDLGVEIRTGVEFGGNVQLETLRDEGYKAIFLAIGTQLSRRLKIPGEDLNGVFLAVEFLRSVLQGKIVEVGERVAVIGGGNSAVDAARTSLRLGARNVTVLYRRSRKEMPALADEVAAAEREGVKFHFLVSPKQIIGSEGRVGSVDCYRMELQEPDESGRRRPIRIPGSEHTYKVDTIIAAIGQVAEVSTMPQVLLDSQSRLISADPLTLETRMQGVFAGGDITTGPASVIEAVKAGKQAAVSIDRYLNGEDLKARRGKKTEEMTWVKDWAMISEKPERYGDICADLGRWNVSFEEASQILAKNKEGAMLEARRCLECGPCTECLGGEELCEADKALVDEASCVGCNVCAVVCPFDAIKKNEVGVAQVEERLCKGCGVCSASCPERAISMRKFADALILSEVEAVFERRGLNVQA